MNYYVVVEGEVGEKLVYKDWIPYVAPGLVFAPTIDAVKDNSFYIVSGGGYPNIFEVIDAAVDDVASIRSGAVPVFHRLVVAVDSEELTREAAAAEVEGAITDRAAAIGAAIDYRVIVQHFCLEAWALGNRRIVSKNVRDSALSEFLDVHNVSSEDPELLPAFPAQGLNRAQAAAVYLRRLLNNKFRRLTYTKGRPDALLNRKYFEQVIARHNDTGHIDSFSTFVSAFT